MFVIWAPFFRHNETETLNENEMRDKTNVELYQEHKAEIERDYQQGAIDEENYQYLITELDKSLLQDMAATEKEQNKLTRKKLSIFWPITMTLFVLAFSIGLYQKQGAYQQLSTAALTPVAEHKNLTPEQQAMLQLTQIQQAISKAPDNSELWYALGQTAISVGDFKQAVDAFDQVIRIEGEQADLLGAKAQALYYQNQQKITAQVQQLIDKALALDALDPSTNVLLGMNSFINQDYKSAINYWQKVVDSGRKNINSEALLGAINEAKNRLAASQNKSIQSPSADQVAGPKITLAISLSDSIKARLAQGEDKIVFVYAIPADGRRMPLAAMKIKTSDLPTTLTLSNAHAMSPQFNLSSSDKVHIFAVVSNQGSPGIKSGDFKAELKNISTSTTDTINLVIDSVVP
jgi:cytochrome c-type biogenesis protein CcmH